MLFPSRRFEEAYMSDWDEGFGRIPTVYFMINKEDLDKATDGKYHDATGGEIALRVCLGEICAEISPTIHDKDGCGLDYDWKPINLSEDDTSALLADSLTQLCRLGERIYK